MSIDVGYVKGLLFNYLESLTNNDSLDDNSKVLVNLGFVSLNKDYTNFDDFLKDYKLFNKIVNNFNHWNNTGLVDNSRNPGFARFVKDKDNVLYSGLKSLL